MEDALLGKTDWYSAEKKIILTIALAILIASVSVFAILYLMMSTPCRRISGHVRAW